MGASRGRALEGAGCAPVTLLGGDIRLGDGPWPMRPDAMPGAGPGAAVHDAATRCRASCLVVAACDLPALRSRDVAPLLAELLEGAAAAAYRVGGRAQWSLVALAAPTVEAIAARDVTEGVALQELFQGVARLCAPADIGAVTDIDLAGQHRYPRR